MPGTYSCLVLDSQGLLPVHLIPVAGTLVRRPRKALGPFTPQLCPHLNFHPS